MALSFGWHGRCFWVDVNSLVPLSARRWQMVANMEKVRCGVCIAAMVTVYVMPLLGGFYFFAQAFVH